jgi:hypothetical protein
MRLAREGAQRLDALLRDHHHLAVLHVAHEAGADDVERAGLGGEDVAAVELAETSGRMPSGSRAPISFLLVSATRA